MIYEENPPNFDEIIHELMELKKIINELPWSLAKNFPIKN